MLLYWGVHGESGQVPLESFALRSQGPSALPICYIDHQKPQQDSEDKLVCWDAFVESCPLLLEYFAMQCEDHLDLQSAHIDF
jgi:hypothetical protein